MQFEFTGPQNTLEEQFGGHYCINAFGRINVGDCDRFHKFLQSISPPPRSDVYISSEGGSVDDAIKIGILIREAWFSTHVGTRVLDHNAAESFFQKRLSTNAYCMSAATLMYLGGRLRYLDENAKFGVHQFSFTNPTDNDGSKSQILSADIAHYLSKMDIDPKFLDLSAATPNSEIQLMTKSDLEELNIVTGGQRPVEWTVQARNNMLYVRGERDSLYGHHKLMLGYTKEVGFLFWAVIETQGRENELLNFGLVEVTVDNETSRIDISKRCERFVSGNYVNVISPILDSEAKLIAYSKGFGLQIRHSKDAEMFLGIADMTTSEGAEQLTSLLKSMA